MRQVSTGKQRKKLLPVHQSLGGDCMKKIIAISVMFVLIAGAAFADTSLGGNMRITANLLSGKDDGSDAKAGGITVYDSNLSANWSGDNAGGMMRLHAFGWVDKDPNISSKPNVISRIDWTPDFFGFVWWKPIDQLRLQIGKNADGDWGHAQISGWGYNAEAQNGAAVDLYRGAGGLAILARTAAWWSGFDKMGLALSIFPAEGFEVNIGIPMAGEATAEATYLNTKINFKIDIADVGTVRLAADLGGKNSEDKVVMDAFLGFYISAIEGMGIDVGAAFKKEFKQIEIAIGYKMDADDFGLKARLGVEMPPDSGDKKLGINIMPTYNLGSFKFFFNAGFGMNLDKSDQKDWFVNPYIQVPTSAGSFYAGIQLIDNGDEKVEWKIPIQWNVYY
jgi:hypothetical protein